MITEILQILTAYNKLQTLCWLFFLTCLNMQVLDGTSPLKNYLCMLVKDDIVIAEICSKALILSQTNPNFNSMQLR